MKKIYILLITFSWLATLHSQTSLNIVNTIGTGYSTSVVSDYQCLGVNPANLGWSWDNHMIHLGLAETGLTIYTNAVTKQQLYNDVFNNDTYLDMTQRIQAATEFTDTRLWGLGGETWLGLSVNIPKIGGFGFSIRDRFLWNTVLNSEAARFIFLGYHDYQYFDSLVTNGGDTTGFASLHNRKPASTVYDGTKAQFVWYREYNFGFGREIIKSDDITLYAGIGVKYLVGYGTLQYYIDHGGQVDAFSSLGPEFKVDYGEPTPNPVTGSGVKSVGHGWGFDIGLTLKLMKKLRISAAITDIGSIKWDGNVYTASDVTVYSISTPGITNYNIFTNSELIKTNGLPNEPPTWQGVATKTVNLPMSMRAGADLQLIPQIDVGADIFIPLNKDVPGSYDKAILGFGAKFDPLKWIEISAGVTTGADVGTHVPLGLSFYPVRNAAASWQVGFAIPDILTLFKSNDIMTGFAFGFLRFGFGKTTE
jgi:hypothetical protein